MIETGACFLSLSIKGLLFLSTNIQKFPAHEHPARGTVAAYMSVQITRWDKTMAEWIKQLPELVVKGLPNFLGLVVAIYLLYQIVIELSERNKTLTDALLACAGLPR